MKNATTAPNAERRYDWRAYRELQKKYSSGTCPVGNGENIAHLFFPKNTHEYYWIATNLERIGLGHSLSPDGTVRVIWP